MQIRKPKKGIGVPKQTPENNLIKEVESLISEQLHEIDWSNFENKLIENKFFETGMVKQKNVYANVLIELAGGRANELIKIIALADIVKIRGISPAIIKVLYENDLDTTLENLKFTAEIEGTEIREFSCGLLHNLFIKHGIKKILDKVKNWINHENEGVRRVVTEGLRPRLMMVKHIDELKKNPSLLKPILQKLLDDNSLYVRKSVANCLNDVSKDHPETLLEWTIEWTKLDKISKERTFIINRALRTLVKNGDEKALKILGYTDIAELKIDWKNTLTEKVQINSILPFELTIKNNSSSEAKIVANLEIDAPGKNEKRRLFQYQFGKASIKKEEAKTITKKIHFTHKTTQNKEKGTYIIRLFINSIDFGTQQFIY